MTAEDFPNWFESRGFHAWAEGMAGLLRRKVIIADGHGHVLVEAGEGEGEGQRFPFHVNGIEAGHVEITPGDVAGSVESLVVNALLTLESLAEARNTVHDLVQTTAHQWRELSLLYRFAEWIAGDQDSGALAEHIAAQARRALKGKAAAMSYRFGEDIFGFATSGDDADELQDVVLWGAALESGAILSGLSELRDAGFSGRAPEGPLIVAPLRARGESFGALAVTSGTGELFEAEDLKLATLLAHQAGMAFANLELIEQVRDRERIQRELEMAGEIQSSILPPPRWSSDRFDLVGTCLPAQLVGGDAYLAIPLEDGLLAGVADVSGHGLSSALLMNAFASEVMALSMTSSDPARLLEITNKLICRRVGTIGLFVTVILARFQADGSVSIANAGHLPALALTPDGGLLTVETSGLPLGVMPDETYEEVRLEGKSYETIVTFSDGVTEARDPDGKMYGLRRLQDLLSEVGKTHRQSEEIFSAVLDDLTIFSSGEPRTDDLTLLVVRRKG